MPLCIPFDAHAFLTRVSSSKNKFVHLALQKTIALAVELRGAAQIQEALIHGFDIAIVGDNDFYSQRAKVLHILTLPSSLSSFPFLRQLESLGLPRALDSLTQITPFSATEVHLSDVHKTGLGSSAALITSLTSAILVHLSVISESSLAEHDSRDRLQAHNLAQYVHCLAQGKVGSGFDVSAAVFGSHLYSRFDPAVIQDLMSDDAVRLSNAYITLSIDAF